MARRIGVELVLDDAAYLRGLQRSARGTSKFVKEIETAGRGAAAGSGLFRGFGRSIAFASGGFLAFGSATKFLTDSISAAREAVVAQRSLAAQMKVSGQSFGANREQIEQVARSYAKFGFQNDEVIQSLTVLVRGTGDINKAFQLQGLAADLARAKNIGLAAAANTVAKVFGGQETALRRAVPGLQKNAHGWDLIREAQQKLAGQAAANTTASERFASTLHDTQEIIGTALLPVLDNYLNKLSTWMSDTDNQKKLQKNLNTAVGHGATLIGALATSLGDLKSAWDKLPDFGKHKGLLDLLNELPGPKLPSGGLLDILGVTGKGGGGKSKLAPFPLLPFLPGGRPAPATIFPRAARPLGLGGQFNLAELKLAQAALKKTQADDRRILVIEAAILQKQIDGAKKLKEKIALTNQLAGVQAQILSIDQASADAKKAQTEQIKRQNQALRDRADAIKSAILDRLQRRQTDVENKRALEDAQAQLRFARGLGGSAGIRLAQRGVNDAKFQQRLPAFTAAPATLRAGKFALGNIITINVHGNESPEKVAKEVVAIIQRRGKHTATQPRGPTAGVGH